MATCVNVTVDAPLIVLVCAGLGAPLFAQKPALPESPRWVTTAVELPRVQHRTFDSKAVGTKVSYHIYTPSVYDRETARRFPVMYWLAGSEGGDAPRARLVENVNARIEAGTLPPMLIVFANGITNSFWVDSKDGRMPMETIAIKELLPHIDATFRTVASAEGRLIEGVSMGGYGAAHLGFKYPGVFGSVSMISAGPLQEVFDVKAAPRGTPAAAQALLDAVFGGDQDYFRMQSPWALAEQNADAIRDMRIRQIVGDQDNTLENNRKFDAHLNRLKIPHAFIVLPGIGHGEIHRIYPALGDENFAFYRDAFSRSANR